MGLASLLLVGYERERKNYRRRRERVPFMGRLCKQKLFQGFRRVKVREESEGAQEQAGEKCATEERVM